MTDPIIAAAQFLLAQLDWCRHATDEQGGAYAVGVFAEIGDCAGRMRSLVEGPAAQRYLGPCGASLCASTYEGWTCVLTHEHPTRHTAGDGGVRNGATWMSYGEPEPPRTCEGDVYGRPGADKGRCKTCGAQVSQDERRAWLDDTVRQYAYTAREIADAYRINVKTIRSWADRGLLAEHGRDRDGRPLHNLGEVLELAAGDAARREEARAERARRREGATA